MQESELLPLSYATEVLQVEMGKVKDKNKSISAPADRKGNFR